MKTYLEEYRLKISRLCMFLSLFVLCITENYWENNEKIITFILFSIGIFLVAIASLGRMWCSLFIAGYKDNELITQGPYSMCRNPLYFFSMIGALGVGFVTETFIFPILIMISFFLYYPSVIKDEENRLKELFGESFENYKKKVPQLFPKFSNYKEPEEYLVKTKVYKRHMFSALWFVWIVGILELIEGLRELRLLFSWCYIY